MKSHLPHLRIDVSIQSIMPLPRHEQQGTKKKRKSQNSEIMTLSTVKNMLKEKAERDRELEEAKANRAAMKNKSGVKN